MPSHIFKVAIRTEYKKNLHHCDCFLVPNTPPRPAQFEGDKRWDIDDFRIHIYDLQVLVEAYANVNPDNLNFHTVNGEPL